MIIKSSAEPTDKAITPSNLDQESSSGDQIETIQIFNEILKATIQKSKTPPQ